MHKCTSATLAGDLARLCRFSSPPLEAKLHLYNPCAILAVQHSMNATLVQFWQLTGRPLICIDLCSYGGVGESNLLWHILSRTATMAQMTGVLQFCTAIILHKHEIRSSCIIKYNNNNYNSSKIVQSLFK